MKPKAFITLPVDQEVKDYISEYCDVHQWEGEHPITYQELIDELAHVEGLLTFGDRIDQQLIDHAPHLKVVSNAMVGYNNFDLQAMNQSNVIGTNTPYVLDETVADLTFALILSVARRISELDAFVKAEKWTPAQMEEEFHGVDVHHATLGIIGMGRIGEKVARRAKLGFHMNVVYHNRSRKPEVEQHLEINYRDLASLLKESDFIVILTPLTDETYQLIGEKEFKMMKKSAILINVSRGQTVDEKSLIRALKNEEIHGAGLDVFEQEPIEADNPLLLMSNVVTVPHIGSATKKTRDKMAMRAAENLVSVLTGKGPIDPVPYS